MEQLIKIFVNFTKLGLSKFEEKKFKRQDRKAFYNQKFKIVFYLIK